MDLKQLEYFIRVAELGSFTRASIELDIAQPALSRQVRLLEMEFQQHLFIRNGRGVSVTDAGKILLEHGRGILHQVGRTREELNRTTGTLKGRVVLGIPPSLMKSLAVCLTRSFRKHMPDAALVISEGLSVTMLESLNTGRIDIALLYNITPSPEIETIPLIEEDMYLIQPLSSKQSDSETIEFSELADIPLIMPCRPNSIRMFIESEMANIGKKPLIPLEIDSISAILSLVADEQGSAILTKNATISLANPSSFHIQRIINPSISIKLALAKSLRHPTTKVQQKLIDLIKSDIANWIK